MKIAYDIDWKVIKRPNGKEYLDVVNPKLTLLELGHLSMKFDRFLNDNKLIGKIKGKYENCRTFCVIFRYTNLTNAPWLF